MLEQITIQPWEHSASENLFIRKLHYERRRTAGYSFWPMGGWTQLWARAGGGDPRPRRRGRPPATVDARARRDGAVQGRAAADGEVIEADEVIVNAPVWDLTQLFDDGVLPWDLLAPRRSCWRATATAPAGSATGSRPRSP